MYGPKQINLYHMERHQEFTLEKIRWKRFCKTTTKENFWQNSEFPGNFYYKADCATQPAATDSIEIF